MREQNEDSNLVMSIIIYGGLLLVVIGTVAGLFNIGSFGIVLGAIFAFYITWIISTLLISSVFSQWSMTKQGSIGFVVALFILIGIILVGVNK